MGTVGGHQVVSVILIATPYVRAKERIVATPRRAGEGCATGRVTGAGAFYEDLQIARSALALCPRQSICSNSVVHS
jgi:hypothetical protein